MNPKRLPLRCVHYCEGMCLQPTAPNSMLATNASLKRVGIIKSVHRIAPNAYITTI